MKRGLKAAAPARAKSAPSGRKSAKPVRARIKAGVPSGKTGAARAQIAVETLDPAWRQVAPGVATLARKAAHAALAAALPPGPRAELALALGDDALLRRLNRDYRGRDKPTNVLSFPYVATPGAPEQGRRFLGDVAIARETLLAEAVAESKPAAHHLSHLIVHGVLHLLGHDHERPAEARRMEALERKVLAGLGIPDPYRPRRAPRPRRH
ncbi:MAG TPA: rRNA maturation RNase YbeY [Hypericibacter adhaerens]|jgi:probable rRNA maturation factor|uniref:Endoribonuclease YbeY n=1 Tax=Hypericibacter adhaerens TaxID=2602016 RepID=A0A5J6N6S1_9PROT|nr:rRNA maturation RNase YbeY [Hypericibacter adhaerens]QEX25297.1 endoribonuclease YbeY [Hypericibacter adhaerens]HWA43465.1 rRNA maturation RNase YbeY [Hypericibacter adhaerens]